MNTFKPVVSLFVKHRMRTTRVLLVFIALLVLFTTTVIQVDSFWGILFDWVGYFLIVLACLGRVFSGAFICGTKNHKLSTQGPFSIVRNPLYVFSFFGAVGLGFLSGHLTILLLVVMIYLTYYPEVVKKEEIFLSQKFGKEYEDYMKNVPRWIPRQLKLNLPTTFTVYPSLLLKTILDSSLFFIIFPLMAIVNILHSNHVIMTFFPLV